MTTLKEALTNQHGHTIRVGTSFTFTHNFEDYKKGEKFTIKTIDDGGEKIEIVNKDGIIYIETGADLELLRSEGHIKFDR